MASTRTYGGVPAGERHSHRRQALLDAVLDCLLVDGLAGVSVRSVCASARLTPRYFYESFADLDALLVAAVDVVLDEVSRRAVAAALDAGEDTAAQVRAAIDAGYGVVATDARKANALLVAAAGHGPLRERRHRMVTEFADLVLVSITAFSEFEPGQRDQARVTAMFLMGGSADVIEAVLAGRVRLSRARLVDQLTALWLGALTALDTVGQARGSDR